MFDDPAEEVEELWVLKVQLQEFLLRGLIATPERILLDKLYLEDGISEAAITILVLVVEDIVELHPELLNLFCCEGEVAAVAISLHMDVEVGHEVVDVGAY